MTIEVELPDGSIAEFPDGTAPDVMTRAVQQRVGWQQPQATATPAPEGWGPWLAAQAQDIGGAAAAGIGRGAAGLLGLPGTMRDLVDAGVSMLPGAAGGERKPDPLALPSGATLQDALSSATGGASDYQGKSTVARYAGAAGEALPGAVFGPGTALQRAVLYGVLPGVAGEGASDLAGAVGADETGQGIARFAASVAAPMAAQRIISPLSGTMSRANADPRVQELRAGGVEPTAGQLVDTQMGRGNSKLRNIEAQYGGGALDDAVEGQFTSAIGRRVGIDKDTIGSRDVAAAGRRMGSAVGDVAKQATPTPVDPALTGQLDNIVTDYATRGGAEAFRSPAVAAYADDIKAAGGTLQGPRYQEWRSELSAKIRNETHPETKRALTAIRKTVDDAVEAASGTAWANAFQDARQGYAEYKTLEDVMSRSPSASGRITPASFAGAQRRSVGGAGFAQGRGDMTDFATAAQSVLKSPPNSGTAGRIVAGGQLAGLGSAGAALMNGQPGTAAAIAAGAAAPEIIGRTLTSRPGQAWLKNTAIAPASASRAAAAAGTTIPRDQRKKKRRRKAAAD